MKKVCFISLFLTVAGMLSAFAKGDKEGTYYVEKGPNNIFITGGVGSHMGLSGTNFDAGFFKAQNPHVYLGVGRIFHPNWSYRAVLNGWRSSDFITSMESKAYFGNLQLDLMYNMSQAWGGYRSDRVFEASVFAGPYVNFASGEDFHVYPGISAGVQFKFNVNKYLAIDLEGRLARQREMAVTTYDRVYAIPTVGVTYTFGGKKVKKAQEVECLDPVKVEETNTSRELASYKAKNDQLEKRLKEQNDKNQEMTRKVSDLEARVAVKTAGPVGVFFNIGSAEIDSRGRANIQLASTLIKNDPYNHYIIRGYADMATGSPERNKELSEARAQAVYDALVASGVDAKQLEVVGMGGQENMFDGDDLNRIVIIERK